MSADYEVVLTYVLAVYEFEGKRRSYDDDIGEENPKGSKPRCEDKYLYVLRILIVQTLSSERIFYDKERRRKRKRKRGGNPT